ncbi:hypothetical protein [Yoonia sp. 2307UL14-13]|uniref:hypothetical protein n=1 Tax=Yoonia sp. 2307UL14-13 TaxID=3126506 RepID=UPI0030AF01DA
MTTNVIQKFALVVDRADISLGDDGWLPEFVAEMNDAGFSMKGGFYLGMSVTCEDDEDLAAFAYIPVARRMQPVAREPDNEHEAGLPAFMEYRAFPTGNSDSPNWGAAMVNGLIAANRGELPRAWLEKGMSGLETSDQYS